MVFTMMPAGYCRRFQTAGALIAASIRERLVHYRWPPGVPRQRAGHWLQKFLALCRLYHAEEDPLRVLSRLVDDGIHFLG